MVSPRQTPAPPVPQRNVALPFVAASTRAAPVVPIHPSAGDSGFEEDLPTVVDTAFLRGTVPGGPPRRRIVTRGRVIALALVALVAGGYGYPALRPVAMPAAIVTRGPAIEAVYAHGAVEPADEVEVKSRLGGTVRELLVREGDAVTAGQLVARIDAPAVGFDLARGRAELSAATARASDAPQIAALRATASALSSRVHAAREEVHHLRALVRSGTGAPAELEHAELTLADARGQLAANRAQQHELRIASGADVARTRAEVASLEARVDDTAVRAPMDGVVLARHVEPGEVVAINQNLLHIGDVRRLEVHASVDESDVGRLRVGMPAHVRFVAFDQRDVPGHLTAIAPAADGQRREFGVTIGLDSPPDGLRAGMTAEVNVVVQQRADALLVPAAAVRDGHVWVLDGSGRARSRAVTLGLRDLTRVEVTRGLSPGDRVLLGDEPGLHGGLRVRATTP